MIVDSHCHLDFPDFTKDFGDVLTRAEAAGVRLMQTICTRMSDYPTVRALADKHPQIYCSVGVHPCNVQEADMVTVEELVAAATHPKTIGLGETGLDYYHDASTKDLQIESFKRHIEAGRKTGLPLIVHTREADDDTVAILKEEYARGPFKFLIHCFTSTEWLALESIKLGGYISLSGILTFKNAKEIQATARELPLERLLVETDAPYLAPAPHRGKRNEPSYTRHVSDTLAQLKGVSPDACAAQTTANFFALFTKAADYDRVLP